MRRYFSWLILVALLFTASVLTAAKGNDQPKYKVVEVKHLTKADSVDMSTEYLNGVYDGLREELVKKRIFGTVVEDGGTISANDAANAVVLECKITEYHHGFYVIPNAFVEVTLSNRSDHTVIQQFRSKKFGVEPGQTSSVGKLTGNMMADEIKHNLSH